MLLLENRNFLFLHLYLQCSMFRRHRFEDDPRLKTLQFSRRPSRWRCHFVMRHRRITQTLSSIEHWVQTKKKTHTSVSDWKRCARSGSDITVFTGFVCCHDFQKVTLEFAFSGSETQRWLTFSVVASYSTFFCLSTLPAYRMFHNKSLMGSFSHAAL